MQASYSHSESKTALASLGTRLVAFSLDALLILTLIGLADFFTFSSDDTALLLKPERVLHVLLGWLYFAGSETCSAQATLGKYLLIIQLAGIQLSAALIFRFMGKVTINGVRFASGKGYVFNLSMALSTLIVAGLLYWQFSSQPGLQKSSLNTQITEIMHTALEELDEVETIEINARFTRGTLEDLNPVICELYLYNRSATLTDEEVKKMVSNLLYKRIKAQDLNADPMFNITVLDYQGNKSTLP